MKSASLPAPVCRAWFGGSPVSVERVSGGFSGANVYRCKGPQGMVALRQWPSGIRADRIEEIHRVVRTAHEQGCRSVPPFFLTRDGASYLLVGSRCWDAMRWMPGQAWSAETSALSRIETVRAGCQTIAFFHQSVVDLTSCRGPAPAIEARWRRLAEVEPWLTAPLRYQTVTNPFRHPSREDIALAWLPGVERQVKAIWQRHGSRLRDRLKWFLQESFPLQYVLRDVHREHLLFDEGKVSGLIDFDAVRMDTPAADVSRYVSSFFDVPPEKRMLGELLSEAVVPSENASIPALWKAAMAGYRSERPLSDREFRLAKFLAEIGPLLSLVNWAVWSTSPPRGMQPPRQKVAARAEHLSHCLQTTFEIG